MKRSIANAKATFFAVVGLLAAFCIAAALLSPPPVRAEESATPAAIYMIGASDVADTEQGYDVIPATDTAPVTYKYASHSAGWDAAVRRSIFITEDGGNNLVKVVLASDWNAVLNSDKTDTSFGSGQNGFSNGMLRVPQKSNMVLDLNDHTIDRKLVENDIAVKWGKVLYVEGKLVIEDGGENSVGKLTGGYTTSSGGCIQNCANAILTMRGGNIAGNKSRTWGGAIYNSGIFNFENGKISENMAVVEGNNALGGAVYMNKGEFNMSGGEVTHNTVHASKQASGAFLATIGGSYTISGGLIAHNIAESTESFVAGGVVFGQGSNGKLCGNARIEYNESIVNTSSNIQGVGFDIGIQGVLILSDNAEIAYNKGFKRITDGFETVTNSFGGGVCVSIGKFYMQGGKIHHNIAGQGSAIEVLKDSAQGSCVISGGEIYENLAVNVWGAIHYAKEARITVSGNPVIKNNYSLNDKTYEAVEHYSYDNGSEECDLFQDITVYKSNLRINSNSDHDFDINVGTMESGADIHFNITTRKEPFSVNYFENNSVAVKYTDDTEVKCPINPAEYFSSDMAGYTIILNELGEMVELPHAMTFAAGYGDAPVSTNRYFVEYEYDTGKSFSNTLEYDGEAQTFAYKNGDNQVDTIAKAGIYTVSATVDTVPVAYTVVVKPKMLTTENSVIAVDGTYSYDGTAKTPTFALTENGNALVADTDYTYELADNVFAGERAKIIVTYKGNYQGVVTYYFTIAALADKYAVAWQYREGGEWKAMPQNGTPFTYNAVDYSGDVRAVLTAGDVTEYVYAPSEDTPATTNMYLTYAGTFEGSAVTALLNAASYTVTVAGYPNYTFNEGDDETTVTVAPRTLDLTASDFVDYAGVGDANRLWLLQLGGGATSALRDRATYFDPDAQFSEEYGAKVVTGNLYNSYVRYTGSEQTIELNGEYRLQNGKTIGDYMSSISSIEYPQDSNVATGVADTVNAITTKVRINLNGNWASESDGARYIELEKVWYIVTINNALRTLRDGELDTRIDGYTFGDTVTALPFRPEHGDTAIFTLAEGGTTVARFAAVYGGDLLAYELSYYEVKAAGGEFAADKSKPIDEADYYARLLSGLAAGSYSLNVYVPKYVAVQDHPHWWGDGSTPETNGVVYYPVSRTYNFTVAKFALTANNVGDGKAVVPSMTTGRVRYNGKANNLPELTLSFNGKPLEANVDYELASDNVNVGKATLVITGKGNFDGEVTLVDAYDIERATNTWSEIPSVMRWTFGDYKKNVNVFSAAPAFLDDEADLTFTVAADKDGTQPIEGLAGFRIDGNGEVTDSVAAALGSLKAGTYYLFAAVAANDNYEGLAPHGVPFRVFEGVNAWTVTPSITAWVTGSYDAAENAVVAASKFGTPHIVVTDKAGNVVFDSATGVDKLAELEAGEYVLVGSVAAAADYNGLVEYRINFTVFEKPGLPWWAILASVGGALVVVAIILLILWKTGVFRILTDKITLAIRTKATVDAVIASVRASKVAAASRKSVAEAKAREDAEERIRALHAATEAERAKPPEERAAALEAKAKEAAERAARLMTRADRMQSRADNMKKRAERQGEYESPEPDDAE